MLYTKTIFGGHNFMWFFFEGPLEIFRSNKEYYSWKIYQMNRFSKSQPAIACSNLITETVEQGVKYVQS